MDAARKACSLLEVACVGAAFIGLLLPASGALAQNPVEGATLVADVSSKRAGAGAGENGVDVPLDLVVSVLPSPPVRGRSLEITLDITNPRDEPFIFRVEGDLTAAMYVGGSDGVHRADDEPGWPKTAFAWSELSLDPYSTRRLLLDAVARGEDAGALAAGFGVIDLGTGQRVRTELSIEPEWPETSSRVTWTGFFVGLVVALAIGLVAGFPFARLIWVRAGGGARAGLGAAAILGVAVLLGLTLVLAAAGDYRLLSAYRQTTCVVTDRIIVPETTMSMGRSSAGTESFRPLLAVQLSLADGSLPAIWGDGDGGSFTSGTLSWAQEQIDGYEPGGTYPCWYDPKDPHALAIRREILWWPYVLIVLVLVSLALPATMISRRGKKRKTHRLE